MKGSIKNKFSLVIILMNLLALVLTYVISSEMIFKNIRGNFREKVEEETVFFKEFLRQIEISLNKEAEMVSYHYDVEDLLGTMAESGDTGEIKSDMESYFFGIEASLKKHHDKFDDIRLTLYNMKGEFVVSGREDKVQKTVDVNLAKYFYDTGYVYYDSGEDKFKMEFYSPVKRSGNAEDIGIIKLECVVGEKFLNYFKRFYRVDVVLLDRDKGAILSTTDKLTILAMLKNDTSVEVDKTNYYIKRIKYGLNNASVELLTLYETNFLFENVVEVSISLFITLFFVFALLYLVSGTILGVIMDSIKALTMKINSLKEGNFDISLDDLKEKDDEIGLLARDFEKMVDILKNKIDELERADTHNKLYSERLEEANRELKDAQKNLSEKNKNIDSINKILNNRISEITNMYYLIVNISRFMVNERFYQIIAKGIREGLSISKVAIYVKLGPELELRSSLGMADIPEKIKADEGFLNFIKRKEFVTVGEVVDFYDKAREAYVFPLINHNDGELYGLLFVDNNGKLGQELRRSIFTYVRTIVLAMENRKLYLKLLDENTKLENAMKSIQNSERMKNIFLANISHELKIPLVPIKGYTELMLDGKMGNIAVMQRRALKTTLNNIERLQELIENLLSYSKIESGDYHMAYEQIDLEELIEEVLQKLENLINKKDVVIEKQYDRKSMEIVGDRESIKQIFSNLISNALKFSEEAVSITINVKDKKDKVRISIRDTGIGMDESKINELLEDFRQLEEGDTRRHRGLGLGLTLVNKMLHFYNERLYLKSKLYKGTEAYFYLPKKKIKRG